MNRYLLEAAATILANLTAWLVIADPVTVVHAITTWDAEVFLRLIGTTLLEVLRVLIAYL